MAPALLSVAGLVHHSPVERPDPQDEEDDDRDAQPQQHPAEDEQVFEMGLAMFCFSLIGEGVLPEESSFGEGGR